MNKRKIDIENRGFQKRWESQYLFVMQMGKPLCLDCFQSISVCKEYNLRRHYLSFHDNKYSAYTGESRVALVQSLKSKLNNQKAAFNTVARIQETTVSVAASFAVSRIIAKENMLFTDGAAIKQCAIEMALAFGDEQMANKFQSISLTPETITQCVTEINYQINYKIDDIIKKCSYFSIALAENSYIPDISEMLIFIRMVDENFNASEELLKIHPLQGMGCGKIIYGELERILAPYGGFNKCTALLTDGANIIINKDTGLTGVLKREEMNCHIIHCILNQQFLCETTLGFSNTMEMLVKIVNLIKVDKNAQINHKFETFLSSLQAEHGYSQMDNHWLIDEKYLQHIFYLRKEIHPLLCENEIYPDLKSSFIDINFLYSLAFLTDITKYLNTFNKALQKKDQDITNLFSHITGFLSKLSLLKSNLENNDLNHFQCSQEIFNEMHELNTEIRFDMFVPNLESLIENFTERFEHFDTLKSIVLLFNDPLNFDIQCAPPKYQMELCELQADAFIESRTENGMELFKLLPKPKYPILKDFGLQMTSIFGSTFILEKAFTDIKNIKSKYDGNMNCAALQQLIRLSTTNVDIDIDELVSLRNIPQCSQ